MSWSSVFSTKLLLDLVYNLIQRTEGWYLIQNPILDMLEVEKLLNYYIQLHMKVIGYLLEQPYMSSLCIGKAVIFCSTPHAYVTRAISGFSFD